MLIPRLITSDGGTPIGGAAVAMIRLSRALVQAGHAVSIIGGSPRPIKKPLIRQGLMSADVHRVPLRAANPIGRGVQSAPEMFLHTIRMCRRNGCDLVHSHSGYPHWAGLGAMAGSIARRPVVHTLYCSLAKTIDDKKNPLINRSLSRLSLSGVDRIVAISSHVQRSLEMAGIREDRIAVIPPPIDEHGLNPRSDRVIVRRQLGLKAEDQMALFVGNLTRTKGLDLLLKAMRVLLRRFPRVRLVYTIERGPAITNRREREIGELIAGLGLAAHVIELGIVEDMPALMAACDVFVVPYRSADGPSDYPMAMLEAMAVGRPVVATRVGAIPEVIADHQTGILIPADDPGELARGIAMVLSSPNCSSAMGNAGSLVVRERFSSIKVAGQMVGLYMEVLQRAGKEPGV